MARKIDSNYLKPTLHATLQKQNIPKAPCSTLGAIVGGRHTHGDEGTTIWEIPGNIQVRSANGYLRDALHLKGLHFFWRRVIADTDEGADLAEIRCPEG